MRTDELVGLLATGVAPANRGAAARRFGTALPLGLGGSLLLTWLLFGWRRDLAPAMDTALFWIKLAFPLAVAAVAWPLAERLGRPGSRGGRRWWLLALPFLLVWIGGALVLAAAAPGARLPLMLGLSWKVCALNILLLSTPSFAAVFWAMRALAATRPRQAGAVAGLLASAIATAAYCLHCPEMSPAFWALWYVLGMSLPAALGALLGPRLLRW
ncbi:DUF1109 domain-containing protein [Burkholderia gladioli]|uniref:DUF1109 domain-containing protein n=1 Tax=Burkholderia gladioli TaxID=28095 RepID=UPI00163FA928|nr:DUF1109 domain-containing protein [Burkholderia gladioli]